MSSFMQSILIFIETKGTSIVVSIAALVFGILVIKNVMKMIKMAVVDSKLEKSMVKLVLTIVQFLLYFILLIYILTKMGIGITGIVAAFSAFSLAIGLAIQDVIGGLANGLVIVSTRPFKVGDFVQIGDILGTIIETNLMYTVLDTPDKKHVFLPNKTVYNSQILNYDTNPIRRLDFDFGVDYDTDIPTVKAAFLKLLQDHPLVLKDPAPKILIADIDDDEIIYRFRCWVLNKNYWDLYFDIKEQALNCCKDNNIEICYPQITISQREPFVFKPTQPEVKQKKEKGADK